MRKAARELPREIADLDPTHEVAAGLVEKLRRLVDSGNRAATGRLIPNSLLDKLAFAGPRDDVARQAAALYEAGASRVEFGTPHGLKPRRGLELLAERVVPELRA